jgi:hypothetical protein
MNRKISPSSSFLKGLFGLDQGGTSIIFHPNPLQHTWIEVVMSADKQGLMDEEAIWVPAITSHHTDVASHTRGGEKWLPNSNH